MRVCAQIIMALVKHFQKLKQLSEGLQYFLIVFIAFGLSLHNHPKSMKVDEHIFVDFHQKKLWAHTTGNSEIP